MSAGVVPQSKDVVSKIVRWWKTASRYEDRGSDLLPDFERSLCWDFHDGRSALRVYCGELGEFESA